MSILRTVRQRQRPTSHRLYQAKYSVNVPAQTHTRVLRIQKQYGFDRMGDVVELVTRGLK